MKKKKGSSLITILIFMMFLTIIGTTTITTATTDFKIRTNESKRVENLYGAESGLQISYQIILKAADYAAAIASKAASNELLNPLNQTLTEAQLQTKLNHVFQETYIKVLRNDIFTYNSESNTLLELSLNKMIYPVLNAAGTEFKTVLFTTDNKILNITPTITLSDDSKQIAIDLISTFESNDPNVIVSENTRQVSIKYTIKIPEYLGQVQIGNRDVDINLYPVLAYNKVINVDGDALVKGTVDINGNVQVKGNYNNLNEVIFKKYRSGFYLDNSNLILNGNLITSQTLSLHSNNNVKINNVYAQNVYVGKDNVADGAAMNNNLSINDVFLDNDLSVNIYENGLNHTNVILDNFYGLNDKRIPSLDINKMARESSSIIINSLTGASIEVKNNAYISGVAYIDTLGSKYQTGESVAIKGNYLAYSKVLPGYADKVTLKYFDPLMLIDKINNTTDINEKAKYFLKVDESGQLVLSDGGVKLQPDKTFSAGAIVSILGAPTKSSYKTFGEVETNLVKSKQNDFATEVFEMGLTPANPSEVYSFANVNKTVTNQIDFTNVAFIKTMGEFNNMYGEVFLNNDSTIETRLSTFGGKNIIRLYRDGVELAQPSSVGFDKAIIITNGNVVIDGNVDFTGNIIASGNLTFTSSSNTSKFKYDAEVTKHILAANYDTLKSIFNGQPASSFTVSVTGSPSIDLSTELYDASTYVITGHWSLVE